MSYSLEVSSSYLKKILSDADLERYKFISLNSSRKIQKLECLAMEYGWRPSEFSCDFHAEIFFYTAHDVSVLEAKNLLDKFSLVKYVIFSCGYNVKSTPHISMIESFGFNIVIERDGVTFFAKKSVHLSITKSGLLLNNDATKKFLGSSYSKIKKLEENVFIQLGLIDPREMIVPKRFDIAIKVHYARLYLLGMAKGWREFCYKEQATRITGGGSEIIEVHDGEVTKQGLDEFLTVFHSLLERFEIEEIDAVPVDKGWCAMDGAHRIAAAVVGNKRLKIAKVDCTSKCFATAEFFLSADKHQPIPIEIIDEAAIEYCAQKSGMLLAFIFPTVSSEAFAIECLSEVGEIVHRKDIVMTPEEGAVLLRQAYLGHSWAELSGGSSGFLSKVHSCFPFSGKVRAILLDNCDPKEIRFVKEKIRQHYGVGNHSIHITDGDDEALRMSRVMFNSNSLSMLKFSNLFLPSFHEKLTRYRDWLETYGIDQNTVCIDGSALLSLIGTRDCKDIDFIYHGDVSVLPHCPEKIECHNESSHWFSRPINEIIGDPRLHFWYMGLKFCSPETLLDFKENRREDKDFADITALKQCVKKSRSSIASSMIDSADSLFWKFKIFFRRLILRIKTILRPVKLYLTRR
ncbi:hypothetical protein OPW32_14720 [Vibrio europaeus]|uniref:hypothetical protein n=1 Tax=Vibrio europaeus TaxID=300876 RepID=UPI0023426031|nr:hypothetical protein [Vibrio europaeus]MDC5850457.1 hypothetical protein [Vibrio europaeus]